MPQQETGGEVSQQGDNVSPTRHKTAARHLDLSDSGLDLSVAPDPSSDDMTPTKVRAILD